MARARLRQRVLGAAVILSLGFICYSILIQSNSNTYIDRSAQIPVQTRYIEPLDFENPKGVNQEVESGNPEEMFAASTPVEQSDIDSQPILDDQGKPNSWAIQVGSFSTIERATEIRDQLIAEKYKAYFRRLQNDSTGGELYRVLVGPYVNASEIARHQSEIDGLLSLETILMDYEP